MISSISSQEYDFLRSVAGRRAAASRGRGHAGLAGRPTIGRGAAPALLADIAARQFHASRYLPDLASFVLIGTEITSRRCRAATKAS